MKKFMALLLTMVMVLMLSVTAFAAPRSFVSSPSNNPAPIVEGSEALSEDCFGQIKITPYIDRDELDEEALKAIQEAYDQIAGNVNNEKFLKALQEIADKNKMNSEDLSVSDLFYVGYENCDQHIEKSHKGFRVTLKVDTIKNLKGILGYYNGEWVVLEIESYDPVNGTVTFIVDKFGPVAFVVDKYSPPSTGDNGMVTLWVMVALVSAMAMISTLVLPKRRRV